ncbi:hypothetical protein C7M84_021952 [Penaeus vannamei]|uniref:Uncharacterized protein n=1 Tax=Penaeus vannamei TaxID=6689 RepID=A0A3R7PWG0_PENVA|nr:hypothetical protein C7M84_021952 [Penaeus vannamei]
MCPLSKISVPSLLFSPLPLPSVYLCVLVFRFCPSLRLPCPSLVFPLAFSFPLSIVWCPFPFLASHIRSSTFRSSPLYITLPFSLPSVLTLLVSSFPFLPPLAPLSSSSSPFLLYPLPISGVALSLFSSSLPLNSSFFLSFLFSLSKSSPTHPRFSKKSIRLTLFLPHYLVHPLVGLFRFSFASPFSFLSPSSPPASLFLSALSSPFPSLCLSFHSHFFRLPSLSFSLRSFLSPPSPFPSLSLLLLPLLPLRLRFFYPSLFPLLHLIPLSIHHFLLESLFPSLPPLLSSSFSLLPSLLRLSFPPSSSPSLFPSLTVLYPIFFLFSFPPMLSSFRYSLSVAFLRFVCVSLSVGSSVSLLLPLRQPSVIRPELCIPPPPVRSE